MVMNIVVGCRRVGVSAVCAGVGALSLSSMSGI